MTGCERFPGFSVELHDCSFSSLLDHWATDLVRQKHSHESEHHISSLRPLVSASPWSSYRVKRSVVKYETQKCGAPGLEVDSVMAVRAFV